MTLDIQEMKQKLEESRARLEEELAAHGKKSDTTEDWSGVSESTGESADPNTVADEIEELGTNTAIVEALEIQLRDVNDALDKITGGTYGICEETGEKIPDERLQANPAARTKIT